MLGVWGGSTFESHARLIRFHTSLLNGGKPCNPPTDWHRHPRTRLQSVLQLGLCVVRRGRRSGGLSFHHGPQQFPRLVFGVPGSTFGVCFRVCVCIRVREFHLVFESVRCTMNNETMMIPFWSSLSRPCQRNLNICF